MAREELQSKEDTQQSKMKNMNPAETLHKTKNRKSTSTFGTSSTANI